MKNENSLKAVRNQFNGETRP